MSLLRNERITLPVYTAIHDMPISIAGRVMSVHESNLEASLFEDLVDRGQYTPVVASIAAGAMLQASSQSTM